MQKTPGLPLIGGLIAGIVASLCCVGPLVLLLLGVSGAWIGNLAALEPYRPYFLAVAVGVMVVAYPRIYPKHACEDGKICATTPVRRSYKIGFWLVSAVILASAVSPYMLVWFY